MCKISAVLNTYNAEKYLERVLESLKGFDEIVVCDMESSDSTIDIAKKYNCKIVIFPKEDIKIAEPARQFAIDSASSEYVIVVDADELVPEALKDYLYSLVNGANAPAGLWIPRKNYFMGRYMPCYYPDYILRFFKKKGAIWSPKIHSIPTVDGKVEYIPRKREDLAFIHLADDTYFECIRKMNNYTENERVKRAGKYKFAQFFYMPFFRFFKSYILKGGYRAGKPGFIHAVFDGMYSFNFLAKIEEDCQNKKSNRDIDKI